MRIVEEQCWQDVMVLRMTPHEARQLWLAIDANANSVARDVNNACLKYTKKHGVLKR